MKSKLIFGLLLAACLPLLFTACNTPPTVTSSTVNGVTTYQTNAAPSGLSADDVTRIAAGIRIGASAGTLYAISKDSASKADFQAALTVLDLLINNGTYDPNALQAALKGISLKESQATQADIQLGVQTALSIYSVTYAQAVSQKMSVTQYAPLLKGLRNGIADGLGVPAI